ncbi:hypothetical protein [Kribbella pittospori]|uniref:hypothetical protein n=1 Tax=Kribbella pittospori TaxID=722689 RepID=UPI0013F45FE3|nr:hypothetical protein [Kribbella pittospori]
MVQTDLFSLADEAGRIDRLKVGSSRKWADKGIGNEEWRSYLSGQDVCLRSVTPADIKRSIT